MLGYSSKCRTAAMRVIIKEITCPWFFTILNIMLCNMCKVMASYKRMYITDLDANV